MLGEGDTRVQAVVGYAPVTDFEFELPARGGLSTSLQNLHNQPKEPNETSLAILRETAPVNHVKPGLPPFLLLHGENDRQIPVEDAYKAFAAAGSQDKELRIFTVAEGGAEHCQTDEPDPARQLLADWFASRLNG